MDVLMMQSEWNLSVCGLNCAKCDIYEAGHGNEKLRNEIVEWFKKERHESVKPEKVTCEGCRGPLSSHWSEDCKMMLCAKEKGHKYCFECASFPCEVLSKFGADGVSHHKKTVENLKTMRKIGLEAWIKEQNKKGSATFCP
jgi:hypothetical protein